MKIEIDIKFGLTPESEKEAIDKLSGQEKDLALAWIEERIAFDEILEISRDNAKDWIESFDVSWVQDFQDEDLITV